MPVTLLGDQFYEDSPPNPGEYPRVFFLQALMLPTPPPTLGCSDRRLLHAFQGDVQVNDGKGEKAQWFKGGSPPA